jgi:hypothetical protein
VITCDRCGQTYSVPEWPWCPHGLPLAGVGVIDDTIEGGPRFFETMGHEPVWIASKSDWKREMAQRGLVNLDKHDRAYYQRKFREHDERLRDTGRAD